MESRVQWQNPSGGFFKANWDIALKSDVGRCGVGVIVWDSKGLVSTTLSQILEVCPKPVIAEAM